MDLVLLEQRYGSPWGSPWVAFLSYFDIIIRNALHAHAKLVTKIGQEHNSRRDRARPVGFRAPDHQTLNHRDTMGAVGYAAWIVRVCHKRPQIPNPLHVQLVAFIRAPRLDALPFGMLGALRLHQRPGQFAELRLRDLVATLILKQHLAHLISHLQEHAQVVEKLLQLPQSEVLQVGHRLVLHVRVRQLVLPAPEGLMQLRGRLYRCTQALQQYCSVLLLLLLAEQVLGVPLVREKTDGMDIGLPIAPKYLPTIEREGIVDPVPLHGLVNISVCPHTPKAH
mmetsp:Transcript_16791/g.50173  ORF Transcript_16791/g.50173 Transcript_16791/m.50173 type:complete len:281 (-) Transcript_16791:420-1262(-)